MPAALIACPNKLPPNDFIADFPIQIDVLYKTRLAVSKI
jgi:hypothetical protein